MLWKERKIKGIKWSRAQNKQLLVNERLNASTNALIQTIKEKQKLVCYSSKSWIWDMKWTSFQFYFLFVWVFYPCDSFGPETCINRKLNARSSLYRGLNRSIPAEYQYIDKLQRYLRNPCGFGCRITLSKGKTHRVWLVCVDLLNIPFNFFKKNRTEIDCFKNNNNK